MLIHVIQVLRSIHNPKLSLASGMTNLSPSMSTKLLNGSPSGDPGAGLEISSPEKGRSEWFAVGKCEFTHLVFARRTRRGRSTGSS
jgi:hypothetical protein